MQFDSLEAEVKYLRALVRLTRLADDIIEDCMERQLGLAAALDVFLSHSVRLLGASAGFVEVRGSHGPVLSRVVGRPGVQIETALDWSGPVALVDGRTLFIKPLTLGSMRIGSLGVTVAGHFPDGGAQLMSLLEAMGEQLDTAILGFLAISEQRSPLQKLDELSESSRGFNPRARVGNYELVSPLGTGGMAQVMVARAVGPQGLGRLVALKRILPHLCADQVMIHQFLEEARIGLRLSHPNLVTIYDFGEAGGGYYIAMELVRGVDLDDVIHKAGPLPEREAASIVYQALLGLHAAHELRAEDGSLLNLVHRDLSPHNLMVGFDGRVKILDFGVAKAKWQKVITLPGLVKGKPLYMSPEQATGAALDRRSDLFAMGLILYEAFTGKRPFAREHEMATMHAIVSLPAPHDPRIPIDIWKIIERALEKSPERRFRDALEMADALAERAELLPDVDIGRRVSVLFPERLRNLTMWERTIRPQGEERPEIHSEPTRVRPAAGGK